MKKKNQKTKQHLGNSLINDKRKKLQQKKRSYLDEKANHALQHTTDLEESALMASQLKSITENNDLDEFMSMAELRDENFQAEKEYKIVINSESFQVSDVLSQEQKLARLENYDLVKIPRRPAWTREMQAEELHRKEKEAFGEWRRSLAELEKNEHLMLTPFEKNMQVWRQLWRVVELSDILVQIVDSRNPELYRCEDLETYVKEKGEEKKCFLVLNKADLLTENQRKAWAKYYNKMNISFVFFSALAGIEQLKQEAPRVDQKERDTDPFMSDLGDFKIEQILPKENQEKNCIALINTHHIMGTKQLIDYFSVLRKEANISDRKVTIGMVGYPNVGKSSTINALMGSKKVTVSSTPGKTKHFQTLILDENVMLCDCPGLVFPNFVATKAEMVCNGLLPIDQLRDYNEPVSLVCQRIKRELLEGLYGIILPVERDENDQVIVKNPTPNELLSAYGYIRGFMTKSGTPDQARSARYILKDYVNGILRYVAKPKFKKESKEDEESAEEQGKEDVSEGEEEGDNEKKDKEEDEEEEEDEFKDYDPQEGQVLEKLVSHEKFKMLMKQKSSNLNNGGINNAPREKKRDLPKALKNGYVKPPTYTEKITNPYDPNYQPPPKSKMTKSERRKKKEFEKFNRGNKVFVSVNN